MSTYIVGTGRSGTKSAALHFGGVHEPESHILVPLAAQYVAGVFTDSQAAEILDAADLPEVSAHYKYAELIPVIAAIDPMAEFIWVRRNMTSTVASMVRKGWYHPKDDGLWPVQVVSWRFSNRPALWFDFNHAGFRTNSVITGESTWAEWKALPQASRCEWWWNYCTNLLERSTFDIKSIGLEGLPLIE